MKQLIAIIILCSSCIYTTAQEKKPYGLMTDLLEHTDRVFSNGYTTSVTLDEIDQSIEPLQWVKIASEQPSFSWIVDDGADKNIMQTAYQIIVSNSYKKIQEGKGCIWDSNKVESAQSSAVRYGGSTLESSTVYYWRIKHWENKGGESNWSDIKSFRTAETMRAYDTPSYPLIKTDNYVSRIDKLDNGNFFIDFGQASFGQLKVTLTAKENGEVVIVHLGERIKENAVDRKPAGTTRYRRIELSLMKGTYTYRVKIEKDKVNTREVAILMPSYIGEVLPFRYCEIENYNHPIEAKDIVRESVSYMFDDEAAHFSCSNEVLNQIWDLSRYSIKATSFTGYYVDGDRERIPYEADAYINQLCHYGVDREYSIARRTHEYLIYNATWPTEWILQSVLMAWVDYMYTNDSRTLENRYNDLKNKALLELKQPNGLISSTLHPQTKGFHKNIYYDMPNSKRITDIVDWPHTGGLGLAKGKGGETDGFVFKDYNTVVNAYHYKALNELAQIAQTIGKKDDAAILIKKAKHLKKQFNTLFFDKKKGVYVDGIGTDHSSLHANMFPLAFGLVSHKHFKSVTEFIRSRGMACSVYGSQFLMEAIYDGLDGKSGYELMVSKDIRSWYNMIRVGSTISLEAWDDRFKPNQDWNHAWGAAPANIIPRKLMGVEPISPGFNHIRIRPQTHILTFAEGRFPSIKGEIYVKIENNLKDYYCLTVNIPANTAATVYVPIQGTGSKLSMNNIDIKVKKDETGKFFMVQKVGSGKQVFEVKYKVK